MSENHGTEQVAEADSDSGFQIGSNHAPNGVTESTTGTHQEDASSVAINQQVEHDDVGDKDGMGDPEDGKSAAEDTSKDDMFVDCPDELSTMDSKQSDINSKGEGVAGDDDGEEVNQVVHQRGQFVESGNRVGGDGYSAHEVEQLRCTLEKAVAEKESILQGYEEERETVSRGVIDLYFLLKALSSPHSLLNEGEGGVGEVADVPLNEMIKECLEFVKTASEERPNAEAAISNLQALLSVKDQEIEELNTKVAQLIVSNETWQVSSETQLEKDHEIEIAVDKTISSLAAVVNQEQVLDTSISGKIVYIEEATMLLIEKYNQILSEIYQLGQSFSEVGLGTGEQEYRNILVDAHGGLLELKRKETELVEKLGHLEGENRKLVEELDKERVMIGTLKTELGNMKAELEQEKVKCANTKEKLSMAVTKGKALVQQRDSLKTSLAEKSSELEKCLIELQEKSVALEASELTKEELARSESMVESLKNSLLQNNTILEQVEETLSHVEPDQPEISNMADRVRWLVDDRNVLKGAFLELCKLKDALSLVDLPEHVPSSDLESQMNWLRDSFHSARDDNYILQGEISKIKEASSNYIDRLSIALLLELQEKDYLLSELTDLGFKYEELVGLNHQFSLEKDKIVKMLVELSGLNLENEGIDQSQSSTSMIIDLCYQKLKCQNGPFSTTSYIDGELFERIQSLLYVKDQGLMLYEDILEEETLVRSDVNRLSNELKVASEEIIALKEERSSLLKDLERSEEKSSMLRDKLSMAVKKGKGLVQDRDNLKGLINKKNSEIEQLKLDLQKQESAVAEYRDQINRLSSDVENITKLEADLLEKKRERDRFEQFLMESNKKLQRVVECIDGIVLPVDPVFDEPVEKVKWLSGYLSECQDAKVHAEQELQIVKAGASVLETKLAEAEANVKSLELGLSSSEESISQLSEEKAALERAKSRIEEELQKVKEEVTEVYSTTKSLEDALSQAEKDISVRSSEREEAQVGRVSAERELERVKDEATGQTVKLAEATRTMKDLEDKLSQVEIDVNLLTEKYNADQVVKTDMENELKKLQDEAASHASKLADASETIKSLEEALMKAQNDISSLEDVNKIAKEEISSLGFKLNSCMDELAGKNGSLESRSLELIGLLNDLQLLMKDNTLFPRVKQCFETKCGTLKNMDHVLNKIRGHIIAITAKDSEGQLMTEDDPLVRKELLDSLDNYEIEMDDREISGTDIDTLISSLGKIAKGFQLRNKHIADKFDEISNSIDEFISPLHEKLLETEANMMTIVEHVQIMEEKESTMEKLKEEKQRIISTLENDIGVLLSACTDATSELQVEVDKSLGQPDFISEVNKLSLETDEEAEQHKNSKYVEATQKLKNASRNAQILIRQFESRSEQVAATIEDLKNKLKEATAAFEMVTDERDVNKNRVLQLESDIQLLQSACSELRNNLEGHQALEQNLKEKEAEISSLRSNLDGHHALEEKIKEKEAEISSLGSNLEGHHALEEKLKEKEAEISSLRNNLEGHHALEEKLKEKEAEVLSLHSTLLAKEQESSLLSASQVRDLFNKVDGIKNPILESEENYMELHTSAPAEKLFYIIDSVTKLHNHINSLSLDKQELQSTLELKVLDIKDLKEEVKQLNRNLEDSKMVKNELSDLTFALEKLMDTLGADDWVVDRKSAGVTELILALEKHTRAILLESENSKSKVQELGIKLVGSQKVIDELTTKVKLLEDSLKDRTTQPETVQQRSLFEAPSLPTGSEITEVEEGSSLGKNTISPVPSAAHVRLMRKGSTDHLALDISGESDNLIKRADTDDDKGHAFKSLNTSGLVPKQGKLIADRIDGIWVSGGRILMNRPRARLGLIGYLLILHIWLLGTIL